MRKILSIPLILLVLFSGITVSFATHYCGGNVAGTRVSLKGELATCGMENAGVVNSSETVLSRHCCDNIISFYQINTNYTPSSYLLVHPGQQVIHTFDIPADHGRAQGAILNVTYYNKRPPGDCCPSLVEQQVLCIFRI